MKPASPAMGVGADVDMVGNVVPIRTPNHRRWPGADHRAGPDAEATTAYLQGTLALAYDVATIKGPRRGGDRRGAATCGPFDDDAPDPDSWAPRFLQAAVEAVAGDRPLYQLARWTNRTVYAEIARQARRAKRAQAATGLRASRVVIATVRVSRPSPHVAEVSARMTSAGRSRAIAARLDYQGDRWLCTALTIG